MTVVLHIGFHKTGSSAIQEYLFENREKLPEKGLAYPHPLSVYPSHTEIAWAFLGDCAPWRDRDYSPKEVFQYYQEVISRNEKRGITTIISNEDISLVADLRTGFENFVELIKPYNPLVIAYYRDPIDYILSSYHHAVLEGHTKRSFMNWLALEFHSSAVDFRSRVEKWELAFGSSSIIVREYARDSISDFLSMFAIESPSTTLGKRVNQGIHAWFSRSYRMIPYGPEGETARQHLIAASIEAPSIDALTFYLGREDSEALRARFHDPYQSFIEYAKRKYRSTI